jgi:hypothetical protein
MREYTEMVKKEVQLFYENCVRISPGLRHGVDGVVVVRKQEHFKVE